MQGLVEKLSAILNEKQWKIAFAESCTGGLVSASITHIPGSSQIFDRSFITYSNEAKMETLGVPFDILDMHGAVSSNTAEEMATGALKHSQAQIAISITGIAGPDGGSENKPVGLVFIGYALKDGSQGHVRYNFEGNRESIRAETAREAFLQAIRVLER